MLQRSGVEKWRAGVVSRLALSLAMGVLVLAGAVPMDPRVYLLLTVVALVHDVFVWWVSPRAGLWLDVFNLVFDTGMMVLILQASGASQSPVAFLVYLWLFAMITINGRYGDPRFLVFLVIVGLAVFGLGGWGGPGWWAYMGSHAMGVGLFALTLTTLLGERRLGQLDPLTRVLHRGAGLERLAERIHNREPFDLAFIDLEGFKQVNDTYGHAVGDEVLRGLAGRLLKLVRSRDLVIRYGGDEFLVVGGHGTLAERLGRVFQEPVATRHGPVPLCGDHGVVSWHPDEGIGLEELLVRADAAMYRMKQPAAALPEAACK